jgi:hypothetical protein
MKLAKICLILVLISGLLLLSLAACGWGEPGRTSLSGTPQPGGAQSYDLTATYGADMLHAQLTAIAGAP